MLYPSSTVGVSIPAALRTGKMDKLLAIMDSRQETTLFLHRLVNVVIYVTQNLVISLVVAYRESVVKGKSLFLPLLFVACITPSPSVFFPRAMQWKIRRRQQNEVIKLFHSRTSHK